MFKYAFVAVPVLALKHGISQKMRRALAQSSVAEEGCVNDLSSADSYGDDCDLYDSHPYWCGGYDTEDFNSLEQCCVCQEDFAPHEDAEWYYYYGSNDWYEDEFYYSFEGDCVNDLSSADSYGDNCDLYDHNAHWCGGYDTPDFVSVEQCCVCQVEEEYVDYTEYEPEQCVNDLSTADDWGDDCEDYEIYPGWCGNYDSDTFHSMEQCCVCQGLESYDPTPDFGADDWPAGEYQNLAYIDSGMGNDWHYVEITNPSGDGGSFQWSNAAGVTWGLTAIQDDSGAIQAFEVHEDCPYFNSGHHQADLVRGADGGIAAILGPWGESYDYMGGFIELDSNEWYYEDWYYVDEWYYSWEDAECVNDLSSADSWGDDCDLYDHNAHWCGGYDTPDFNSSAQCCVCQVEETYVDYEQFEDPVCVNDLSTADDWGDDCEDYEMYPGWCGNYDSDTFHSMEQCCVCHGLESYEYTIEVEIDEEPQPVAAVNDGTEITIIASGRLINANNGKCLDVVGSSGDGDVIGWECDGGNDQNWTWWSDGRITNNESGYCLDIVGRAGDGNVLTWPCDGGQDQIWWPYEERQNSANDDDWYHMFHNAANWECLVHFSNGNQQVGSWDCHPEWNDQFWKWD